MSNYFDLLPKVSAMVPCAAMECNGSLRGNANRVSDLIQDMHNERAQMVQALSEATAVEVERECKHRLWDGR